MGEGNSESAKRPARVAMFGYGPDAREQAVRLRAIGWDVDVVVRPGGMSWIRAVADGFRPVVAREAAERASVVAMHLPESEQAHVWALGIDPYLAPGALIVFARGSALYAGTIEHDARFDVVLVTRTGEGSDGCRIAVANDATGQALDRAVVFARDVFGACKVGTTTLESEVQAELAELVAKVGGLPALLAEWDRVLTNTSHEPDEATLRYYERLRAAVVQGAPTSLSIPPSSTFDLRSVASGSALARKRGAA
jgi:ketol-acid reductoisomerase